MQEHDQAKAARSRVRRPRQWHQAHTLYLTSDVWDLEVLGGILLSKVAELFVSSYCPKMRGGTLRFQTQVLRHIRVPDPTTLDTHPGGALRDAFRHRDRAAATGAAIEAYDLSDLALDLIDDDHVVTCSSPRRARIRSAIT